MPTGRRASTRVRRTLRPLAWDEIKEPGAYVEMATGKLYRITRESLPVGRSPANPGGGGPVSPVVKLSKDPFVFELAARMSCVERDILSNL